MRGGGDKTTYSGRGRSFAGRLGECGVHLRTRGASIQRTGSGSGAETWLRIQICLVKEGLPGPAGPASCFQRGSRRAWAEVPAGGGLCRR